MIRKLLTKPILSALAFGLFPVVQLIWEYTHGGIVRHYLLHREDLPSFSNAWGLLTIPLLAYATLWFLRRRFECDGHGTQNGREVRTQKFAVIGFLAGAAFGGLMAVFWGLNLQDYMPFVLLLPLVLAFFIPSYRLECLLGFVLVMAWTFGGVIPVGFGLLLALAAWIIHKGIRGGILRLVGKS